MTKNQRIKFFGASDPEKKRNRSTEERVNEFLEQDSVNAISIAMEGMSIMLLYKVIYRNEDKRNKN